MDECRRGIDVIYNLDFQKAFDSVSLTRHKQRLQACGLSGNLLKWIESFLTGSKMSTFFLDWIQVLSRVCTGPPSFPVKLSNWIVTNMKMFADDTKLWTTVGSVSDSQILLRDLDSVGVVKTVEEWLLNACKYLRECKKHEV